MGDLQGAQRFALTTPQQNILDLQTFFTGTGIANINGLAYMTCELDEQLLASVVQDLIRNHTAFQIRLTVTDGSVRQYFVADEVLALQTLDVRFMSEAEAQRILDEHASSEMPLLDAPLIDVRVIKRQVDWGIFLKLSHVIADAWSLSMCIEQIVGAYLTRLDGECAPQRTSDYAQYIEAEAEYLRSDRCDRDRMFFDEMFEKAPRSITFRDARHRMSVAAARHTFEIDAARSSLIDDYCAAKGVSPAIVFEGALFLYLSRYFDSRDVVIGTPVLNRTGAQKSVMGMFISTVPLRVCVDEDMSASELFAALGSLHLKTFRHQRYPYGRLLEAVRARHGTTDRLYDVTFSYQNTRADLTDRRASVEWRFNGYSETSLTVHVTDTLGTGRYSLHLDYLTDIFSEAEIDLMRRRLLAIVDSVIADDSVRLADVRMMDEDEYLLVTETFNDTKVGYDESLTMVDLFDRAVEQWPDRAALIFERVEWTYRQLASEVDALATELVGAGMGRGDVVGVLTKRSDLTIVAMLAIAKAGAAHLSLDVSHPVDRIEHVLCESGARLVVEYASPHAIRSCPTMDLMRIDLDRPADGRSMPAVEPSDTYCVLQTSGSTGMPKCIALTHRNLVNFCLTNTHLLGDAKVALSTTAQTFDVFRLDTIFPLVNGKTLVLASQEELNHDAALAELIKSQRSCMLVFSVPTRARHWLQSSEMREALSSLDGLMLGGEQFPAELYRRLRAACPSTRIYNGYGPAEATLLASAKLLTDDRVTCGQPLPNYRIHVLRDRTAVVPIGFTGEVCISGDGVAAGYRGSQVGSDAFRAEPFPMYCTGDLGRWTLDGELEVFGRIDNQVKYRGVRIELEGIDGAACEVEGVTEAAAAIVTDAAGNQRLTLYFESDAPVPVERFRTGLSRVFPSHMLPTRFVRVESLPLNSSGKIDRARLHEAPGVEVDEAGSGQFVAFEGPVEHEVASVWRELLETDGFGAEDSFFDAGGDSLMAMRLLDQLDGRFGIKLTVREIFEGPTVREIARLVAGHKPRRDVSAELVLGDIAVHPRRTEAEGVLVTGATGFLGSHVVDELVRDGSRTVHVIVRDADLLERVFDYYFDYSPERFAERLVVHHGDLTLPRFGLSSGALELLSGDVGSIIHCAANVRHYGRLQDSKPINVDATVALLRFAAENGMAFNHVSTISVSGFGMVSQTRRGVVFDETCLDVGQRHWQNVYAHTKFLAEQAVQAYADAGLQTRVLRMGNIGPRASDGRFQMNSQENGFASRKQAITRLGAIERNLAEVPVEVSPVDVCARAVVALSLAGRPGRYHVYHPALKPVIQMLRDEGVEPRVVEADEFMRLLEERAHDDDVRRLHMFLRDITELGVTDIQDYGRGGNLIVNEHTTEALRELGVCWP